MIPIPISVNDPSLISSFTLSKMSLHNDFLFLELPSNVSTTEKQKNREVNLKRVKRRESVLVHGCNWAFNIAVNNFGAKTSGRSF